MEFAFLIPYKLFCKFIKIFKLVICASRKGNDEGPFDLKIYVSSKLCERRQSLFTKLSISFTKTAVDTLYHHIYKSSSYFIFQAAVKRQNARK